VFRIAVRTWNLNGAMVTTKVLTKQEIYV